MAREGFGVSGKHPFIIPQNADGSGVDAVDLGRLFAWIVIRITSPTGIPNDATLAVHLGMADEDTLVVLADDNLPLAADAAGHHVIFVGGARQVRLILSATVTQNVTIDVYGIDAAEK